MSSHESCCEREREIKSFFSAIFVYLFIQIYVSVSGCVCGGSNGRLATAAMNMMNDNLLQNHIQQFHVFVVHGYVGWIWLQMQKDVYFLFLDFFPFDSFGTLKRNW